MPFNSVRNQPTRFFLPLPSTCRRRRPDIRKSLVFRWRRRRRRRGKMSYDDVEIEGMEWNEELQALTYPCPCGDLFQITKDDLKLGEEIDRCPSFSLYITVVYKGVDFVDGSKSGTSALSQSKNRHAIFVA